MPNEEPYSCGTCWFNRANGGEAGYDNTDGSIAPRCEIRDVVIEAPFYTYCANHPSHRPNRDPIPIGPILRYDSEETYYDPDFWLPSPDTEEIRLHLLEIVNEIEEYAPRDGYPSGVGLEELLEELGDGVGLEKIVLWQLGDFEEKRAEEILVRLGGRLRGHLASVAVEALGEIRRGGLEGDYEDLVIDVRPLMYKGKSFEVARKLAGSATVAISCESHYHEEFIIGKIEGDPRWGVGRKSSGSYFDGSFEDAISRCADLLIEECANMDSIAEVDAG